MCQLGASSIINKKRDAMYLKRKNVLGMSPVKPSNMTMREYQKLFKFWNQKLQDAGHHDIEDISPSFDGSFTPFFRKDPTSMTHSCHSAYALADYSHEKEEYYRMCRIFLEHCNWQREFKRLAGAYRAMFHMHTNGAAYNIIAKYFRGDLKQRRLIRQKYEIDAVRPRIFKGRSIFWVHTHMQNIITRMFEWHKTHPEGLTNPINETGE